MNKWKYLGQTDKKQNWKRLTLFFSMLFLFFLAGCSESTPQPAGKRSEKGYSLPQIMIIAMTEKNRYEEICTEQIWDVSVEENGEEFSSYLTGQIKNFMEEMKIMNLLAQDRNMSLTPDERSEMAAAAEEYYGKLAPEDIAHMGVTQEDVRTVFEDYCMAEKLVEELTEGIALEVSDSEAKVITIMQAKAADRQTAENLRMAADQENVDFLQCAEDVGLTAFTRQLGRKEEPQEFEDAAFNLTSGQVSQVIEANGAWYVVKCVSDYDEEATAARKKLIFEERKRKAFQEIYDSFRKEINLTYTDDPWKKLELSSEPYSSGADFFEIYRKHSG